MSENQQDFLKVGDIFIIRAGDKLQIEAKHYILANSDVSIAHYTVHMVPIKDLLDFLKKAGIL